MAVLREFGATPGRPFGDREAEALGVLYERHAGTLLRLARRLTRSPSDAQDVVHDVFVALPSALQRYRPGNFTAWLKRVAGRTALMHLRSRSRRREECLTVAAYPADPDGADGEEPGGRRHVADLERALAALPEPCRRVVALRFYAGLTHREIVGLLGISVNASEVRLCRAVKRLRVLLTRPEVTERPAVADA